MKKFISLLLAVCGIAVAASAQDTVRYPDKWYGYTYRQGLFEYTGLQDSVFYNREDPNIFHTEPCNFEFYRRNGWYSSYYLVPLSKGIEKIYGIALTINETRLDTSLLQVIVAQGIHYTYTVRPDIQYEGYIDSVYLLDVADAPLVKQCKFEYDYSLPTQWSDYSNCYEIYFDTPIEITSLDSNYIGLSNCEIQSDTFVHLGRDTTRSQYPWRLCIFHHILLIIHIVLSMGII